MAKVVAIDLEYQKGFGLFTDFCRYASPGGYALPDEAFYVGEMDGHIVIYEQTWMKSASCPDRAQVIEIAHSESEALDRIYEEKILGRLNSASEHGHQTINKTSRAKESSLKTR